jgi:hypothetical protein
MLQSAEDDGFAQTDPLLNSSLVKVLVQRENVCRSKLLL